MSSDDGDGRVIPFPALGGLRPPIGGGTTTAPPPPPPAPPADQEPESDLLTAFPALAGAQLSPPLALTLPALALALDDEDQAADDDQAETVHYYDGGMTAREAATLGVMVASAITVACLRGTVAFASWCRARAEHHRAVREQAAKAAGSGSGRVPSGPEFGRATRSGGRAGTGSGGRSGGGSAPATFRSGSGSRGAGGSTRPGGANSRPPAASGGGKGGTGPGSKRRNGSGSPTSSSSGGGSGSTPPGSRRKRKSGGDSGGSGSSGDGGGKTPRGPKGIKRRKPKGGGSGSGGGSSSGGSGTSTSPKGKGKGSKGSKGGKGTGTSPASTSPKGKGGGSKSPATRTPATAPATRGARARALARRVTVRAARGGGRLVRRGGRYLARVTPPAARRTGRYLHRNGRRVARHTRRWTRARWDRIAARAEVRWQRRQQAAAAAAAAATGTTRPGAGTTAPSSGPATPPPGPSPTGPGTGTTPPPSAPGASPWGPGPGGGPWVGYGPLTPPPAVTDPYVVVVEREDGGEAPTVELPELVVADGDTPPPDAPPGQAWEPLKGVDGGWVLVDVAEIVEPEPAVVAIPAARAEAAPASKETTPVTELPATPSAIAEGVAAMAGPRYDSGASELTIYDLTDADEDAAEEIVARADTAHQDAKAAAALVNHMEDLKATIVAWKIPGALYRYACRLQEKAAALAVDSRALAQELPAASEAIKTAGANAAARHKPLADTVRDLGHAAPAEADYHG